MNVIVTTTINSPTEAIRKFAAMPEWELYIVGDNKTPHAAYEEMESVNPRVHYLSPSYQECKYQRLSALIGWNCIQRRSIGFVEAMLKGSPEIIATVDDDNIPYEFWGKDLFVNKESPVHKWHTSLFVFDPMWATTRPDLWHRGFPIQLVKERYNTFGPMLSGMENILVQADLWDGEADVDAIERISMKTDCECLSVNTPFSSNAMSPFNSQNTFISAKVIHDYFMFPGIGRMDDIWASYYLQAIHGPCVVYGKESVIQKRNDHSLIKDIKDEMLGHEFTEQLVKDPLKIQDFIPSQSWAAFQEYRRLLGK